MEAFLGEWNTKFGPGVKPPESVFSLGLNVHQQPENVGKAIGECIERIDKLKQQLEGELFFLAWLRKHKDSTVKVEEVANHPDQVNHVREDVFVDSNDQKGPTEDHTVSRKPKLVVNVHANSSPNFDTDLERRVPSRRSEDSPNSSEYYTAGPYSDTTSASNLTEEEPSPGLIRQRFNHHVTSNDIQVAKLVRRKVVEGQHWSCLDLNQVTTDGVKFFRLPSPKARHKRYPSAPELNLKDQRQKDSKKRIFSAPCNQANRDAIEAQTLTEGFSPLPQLQSDKKLPGSSKQPAANQNKQVSPIEVVSNPPRSPSKGSYASKVVLRDKTKRGRSFSMDSGRASSSVAGNRSSNGLLDSIEGNYVTSPTGWEDDDDPALINIMASRVRTLRTPRTSTSQAPSTLPDPNQVTSPDASSRHFSASGSESDTFPHQLPLSGDGKHVSSFLRRRNTDSSPVKRVSYYSDDECLTPRIDPGDPLTFAANSPLGSQGCSHRNSRSSNGILDEDIAYDFTLKRGADQMDRSGTEAKRKSTENGASSEHRNNEDETEEDQLTKTITAYSIGGGGGSFDSFDDSPSDSLLGLGRLEVDIAATLSKFGDRPELSMAGLLDVKENRQMNTDPRNFRSLDPTLEDLYEESIEVDEATISALTLNNDFYGSRSNSANSLPGLFSDNTSGASSSPPEQESPSHSSSSSSAAATATSVAMQGVNLRVGVGRRRNIKRMGNADLEAMAGVNMCRGGLGGSDTDDKSISSTSLNSEEDSSVPTSPQGHEFGEPMVSKAESNCCVCRKFALDESKRISDIG